MDIFRPNSVVYIRHKILFSNRYLGHNQSIFWFLLNKLDFEILTIYQQITRTILFEQPKQKQNLNKGFNSSDKSMKAAFGKKEVLFISC